MMLVHVILECFDVNVIFSKRSYIWRCHCSTLYYLYLPLLFLSHHI